MIQLLLFGGGMLSLIVWLSGLSRLWRGEPNISFIGAGLGLITGLIVCFGAVTVPRYSEFWLGSAGQGDGFGLIGLTVCGAIVAAAGMILLVVTAVITAARGK